MQWKRLFYFLLINVFVSVVTTLVVLMIWDRTHRVDMPAQPVAHNPEVILPTTTRSDTQAEAAMPLQAYQVGAGETLGEIAQAFEISVEELLEINGIDDPDSIGAGLTIFVPASEDALASNVKIEIVAVIAPGDLTSERVKIQNSGDVVLSLAGWQIQDEDGNRFVFPQITLYNPGALEIYSKAGVDSPTELYWAAAEPIWQPGEQITLLDGAGNIQAQDFVK